MNNKLLYTSTLLLSGFMLTSSPAHAKIYKCVNTKGAVFYNDKPCPKKNKETELKAVKDPKSRYIPKPYPKTKEDIKRAKGVIVGNDPEKNEDQNKELKDSNNIDLKNEADTAKKTQDANSKNPKNSFADPTTSSLANNVIPNNATQNTYLTDKQKKALFEEIPRKYRDFSDHQ